MTKKQVIHQSIVRPGPFGGTLTTTLCGRMDNHQEDGYNVGADVSCKHCLRAASQPWGTSMVEKYAPRHA